MSVDPPLIELIIEALDDDDDDDDDENLASPSDIVERLVKFYD